MESTLQSPETYTDKKLTELLEYATSDLEPGVGFKLELQGIKPLPILSSELEAYFNASLNSEKGAKLVLGFDEKSDRMVLQDLTVPLQDVEGYAQLHRSEFLGYVPALTIRDKQFNAKVEPMDYEAGDVLLMGFGIDIAEIADYKNWRDFVITQTSAWRYTEMKELALAFTEDSVQSVILSRASTMDLSKSKMNHINTFTRSIVTFDTEADATGKTTSHVEMSLQSIQDLDEHTLPLSLTTYNKKADILKESGFKTKKRHTVMLPLNEDSYQDMRSSLEEAIAILKAK